MSVELTFVSQRRKCTTILVIWPTRHILGSTYTLCLMDAFQLSWVKEKSKHVLLAISMAWTEHIPDCYVSLAHTKNIS